MHSIASTVTSLQDGKVTLFVTNNTLFEVTYLRDAQVAYLLQQCNRH